MYSYLRLCVCDERLSWQALLKKDRVESPLDSCMLQGQLRSLATMLAEGRFSTAVAGVYAKGGPTTVDKRITAATNTDRSTVSKAFS